MTTSPPIHPGRVAALHRYPVKSLVGEAIDSARLEERGVQGDRTWAVQDADGKLGSGKSTRRFRRMDGLLALASGYDGDVPVIAFPDGRQVRGDDPAVHDRLSRHVGRPVALSREADVPHVDEGPVHLVTSATLQRLGEVHGAPVDARRFRPNLVVDVPGAAGFVEEGWVGRRLAVGSQAVLAVRAPMPRCVMVDLPQRDLPRGAGLLDTVFAVADGDVGVVADVLVPGSIRIGDEVRLLG